MRRVLLPDTNNTCSLLNDRDGECWGGAVGMLADRQPGDSVSLAPRRFPAGSEDRRKFSKTLKNNTFYRCGASSGNSIAFGSNRRAARWVTPMTILRERLAMAAYKTGEHLHGLDEPGRQAFMTQLFEKAELVFAVWNDPAQPEGIDYLLIKGPNLIGPERDDAAVQADDGLLRVAVMPCLDEKIAVATQGIFGAKLH